MFALVFQLTRSHYVFVESKCNCFIIIFTFVFFSLYAAAAAKSLQLCPTLCNPIDRSPPGSSVPGILQARILEWVAISFSIMAESSDKMWSTEEGNGKPLQYSCLEKPMNSLKRHDTER